MYTREYTLAVSLILSLSITTPTQAADTSNYMHHVSLGSDLARIACTNAALIQQKKRPTSAATLHAAAASLGIINNLVLIKLLQENPNAGDQFAIASSMSTHLIDLIIHCKNMFEATAHYQSITKTNAISIYTAQLLEVSASYLTLYTPASICKTADFQTAMHNLHAGLEAFEKLLLTSSYNVSATNENLLTFTFASIALANAGTAIYYPAKKAQEDRHKAAAEAGEIEKLRIEAAQQVEKIKADRLKAQADAQAELARQAQENNARIARENAAQLERRAAEVAALQEEQVQLEQANQLRIEQRRQAEIAFNLEQARIAQALGACQQAEIPALLPAANQTAQQAIIPNPAPKEFSRETLGLIRTSLVSANTALTQENLELIKTYGPKLRAIEESGLPEEDEIAALQKAQAEQKASSDAVFEQISANSRKMCFGDDNALRQLILNDPELLARALEIEAQEEDK